MANRRHKLINATATPKTHTHVEADITDLGTYLTAAANEAITGDWTFSDQLAIINGADSVTFQHGGTDLTVTGTNTTDLELVGFTGALDLRDGMDMRLRDAGDTKWLTLTHGADDFTFAFNNTTDVLFTGAGGEYFIEGNHFNVRGGGEVRSWDTGNTDYILFTHTDIVGRIDTNAGPIEFPLDVNIVEGNNLRLAAASDTVTTTGARMKAEQQSLADDATGVFMHGDNSTYRMHIMVNNFNQTTQAIWFQVGQNTPAQIYIGSNVQIAATVNPDVDGDVNIWHSSGTGVSIKNRLGSTRTFTLYSIGL